MNINVAMLEAMKSEGLDLDGCIRVLRAAGPDTAADRRRAYDRERKREKREGERLSGGKSGGNPPDPSPNEIDNLTPTREKPKPIGLAKKRMPIPDNWQAREFALGTESRKVVDSWPPGEREAQFEQFMAHHRSKRNTFHDPQDAWSTWVLNTRKWGIGKNERSEQPNIRRRSTDHRGRSLLSWRRCWLWSRQVR
jgi:hypothetical protein